MEDEEIGIRLTSSPIQNPESSIVHVDRRQLAHERDITRSKAVRTADFVLAAIDRKTGNVFQYLGYLNAIKERQARIKRFDKATRANFNDEALILDIRKVEIEHKGFEDG